MADQSQPGTRRPTASSDDAPEDDQPFGDLSGAAREAVRQGADPRIDAHLARLGLTGDAPAATAHSTRTAGHPEDEATRQERAELAASVEAMTSRLAALEAQVQRLGGALQLIGAFVVVAAVLAVVALAITLR
jgi:hypothetical protein